MNRSDKIEQVSASLFAVHRDLKNPRKDAKGQVRGKANYEYLSLPSLIDHLRPMLKDAQLYVTQEVTGGAGFVEVTTTVWHLSGQHIEFGPTFMPYAGEAQQAGSATTYARRYALAAVFNLAADEDDDAARSSAGASRPSIPAETPRRHSSGEGATGRPDPVLAGEGRGDGAGLTHAGDPAPLPLEDMPGEPLATEQQWANLLAMVDGKVGVATQRINTANGTNYTYRAARAGATKAELVRAVEG